MRLVPLILSVVTIATMNAFFLSQVSASTDASGAIFRNSRICSRTLGRFSDWWNSKTGQFDPPLSQVRILLNSGGVGSKGNGTGRAEIWIQEIDDFLGPEVKTIAFIPYADPGMSSGYSDYTQTIRNLGYFGDRKIVGLHEVPNAHKFLSEVDAIYMGGGNTPSLLKTLREMGLLSLIRKRVAQGVPYIGQSAGIVVSGLGINTSNDMHIVANSRLDALRLLPFYLNPHYLPGKTFRQGEDGAYVEHKGETREERIFEFLRKRDSKGELIYKGPVVALDEGTFIRVDGGRIVFNGPGQARIMKLGDAKKSNELNIQMVNPNTEITDLIRP